ncbi:NAD-dependent epimerase/dehydratase family protein [Neptunicella sp.]|uniref:NAD-dependent epimerase/dehydratase family protein n=1 Tax=Neptunicella sp. TaxID=2125986 RepID=UPI003F68D2B6
MITDHQALVLGASGLVGQQLVQQLLLDPRYTQVTCLVRQTITKATWQDPRQCLQQKEIDFTQLADCCELFEHRHIYVCLGTTIKQAKTRQAFRQVDFDYVYQSAQIAAQANAVSFVWISSVGANASSHNFYLRVKGELEQAIAQIEGLTVANYVRPSLLLGHRPTTRLLESLGIAVFRMLSVLMLGPLAKYRPIPAADVASQMIMLQKF